MRPPKAQVEFSKNYKPVACIWAWKSGALSPHGSYPVPPSTGPPLALKGERIGASLPNEFMVSLLKPYPGCCGPSAFALEGL